MNLSPKAQASLDKVIEQFKAGDLSPIVEMTRIQPKATDKMPFTHWSLANRILAFIQSAGQIDSRGFKQWQEVNRRVRKGGQAVYIFAPCTRKIEEDGEQRVIVTGFRAIPVFPFSETEGDPLPQFDYNPVELPPLADVATRMGVNVTYAPLLGDANGFYSPGQDSIVLGTHEPRTFFHELAHAAHNRIESLKGGQNQEQETVAEFSAAVLANLYGFDYTGNVWSYIEHYADDPLTAILKALGTVEKVLTLILEEPIETTDQPKAQVAAPH